MFEHLTNCHGEWQVLFTLLASLPIVGTWLRARWKKEENDERG